VFRSFKALLMLAITATGANSAPKLKDGPVSFYPTRIGSCWVYDVDGVDETRTITHVRDEDGAKLLTVEWTGPRYREPPVETIKVSAKAVSVMGFKNRSFDNPICLQHLPPTVGETWNYHLTGPVVAEEKGTATIQGRETIEVPAGKFTTYRVVFDVKDGGVAPTRDTVWFADIGLVKEVTRNGNVRLLKSFTPGKKD
jgi:hypothetical protein